MGRFFVVLVLAGIVGGATAWTLGLLPESVTSRLPTIPGTETRPVTPVTAASSMDLGPSLYPAQPVPQNNVPLERQGADPVVISGNLTVVEKMDASAQVPGQILFIGQEIPEGAAQIAGVAPFLQSKIYPALVDQGDSNYYKLYYRLSEGEIVGEEDMVGLVNPARAVHDVREKKIKLVGATAEFVAAEKIDKEAEKRLRIDERLHAQGVGSEIDLSNARLTRIKTEQEFVAKRESMNVAMVDFTKSKMLLRLHYVANKLPVKMSIIKTIYKRTGEAVKELEPVLHLYAIDRLTAEGLVELQFANRLTLGRKVTVEPTRETSPLRVWRSHKKEITAVAVTHSGLAVSASEDGTVCLWDERFAGPISLLRHNHPVRSLACSPGPGKEQWLLAGLSDGSIVVWNLDQLKDNVELKPFKTLSGMHGDAITALAFSPDGKYFASGSTDGSIMLWSPESPSECRMFPFDSAHGVDQPHSGQITSLHFTPQSRLVSAGRDNTLRIWALHEKGARLVGEPIGGRSGTVAQLGVSRDGGSLLFDQGKTLQVLSADGRTVSTLQNPAGATPFETLAQFSPDASMLLTAGAAEGRLQLWRAPLGGKRAYEVRQFVTSERSSTTSAAFSDINAAGETPFAVSGTKDGIVYLWPLPTRADVQGHPIDNVKLSQISQNIETRQVRIGVEVPNDGKLIPGQPVTIVIESNP